MQRDAMLDDRSQCCQPGNPLVAAHRRDLNCLAHENRQIRRRALEKLLKVADSGSRPEDLAALWSQLRAPALKLFGDSVEKNRELSIYVSRGFLAAVPSAEVTSSLPEIIDAVVERIGGGCIAENVEELRLALLELLQELLKRGGKALAPHLPELVPVLGGCLGDAFPDAKKAACALVSSLAETMPADVEAHCAALTAALQQPLCHQHSRVRSIATDALFALLLVDPSVLNDVGAQLTLIATDRAPAVREQSVHALASLLARKPSERAHVQRLLPLLLCALSDEVDAIAAQARTALNRLGDLLGAESGGGDTGYDAESVGADIVVSGAVADTSDQPQAAASFASIAGERAAAAAAAADGGGKGGEVPTALAGGLFAEAPHPATAALVGRNLAQLLPPISADLSDWTAKTRQRGVASTPLASSFRVIHFPKANSNPAGARTLIGVLWCAGPAATEHLDTLLPSFLRTVEDPDEEVVHFGL